ncbi:MAG: DUF4872 domain-containing protein [Chitinophagaceae bacterium]|nr:MAG: DUF4872 domain-containing protein [Chitinophagaceae bacterium]
MQSNFLHHQSAHCENGVVSNLLRNKGLDISEPMAFGIGSGLFFVYLPFIKVNHAPAISYRTLPGFIFKKLARRLGLVVARQSFRSVNEAQKALEQNLKEGIPTGLQVGVYQLSYFPDEYRFHFNAHNLVVYGRTDEGYLISDPVMEKVTTLTVDELNRVRFAKGAFAPKGKMYHLLQIPAEVNIRKAVIAGINDTCRNMLAPVPIVGTRGMQYLASQIRKWPSKHGVRKANHYLAQMVRMQEEIGTGGGGFRFIYAAFLQEASYLLDSTRIRELSNEMTALGDLWRDFALEASRLYKNRSTLANAYDVIADQLLAIANREKQFYKDLKKAIQSIQSK